MAEGLMNHFLGDRYRAASAGIEATRVNPLAVRVLEEIGIDMSTHRSKSVEEFRGERFDTVVTVCDSARESCPFFPGKRVIHRSFRDPSHTERSDEEVLHAFRETRDEIRAWLEEEFP
jgi:arsenate reductase